MTTIYVNGIPIKDVKKMKAKFPGTDALSKERFNQGDDILFKHNDRMTEEEVIAIFGRHVSMNFVARDRDHLYRPTLVEENKEEKEETSFTPSPYQAAILNHFVKNKEHLLIKALAGCGKTSTLVWILKEAAKKDLITSQKIVYLAFNTTIRDELNVKLRRSGINAMTSHQYGFSILRNAFASEDGNTVKLSKGRDNNLFLRDMCRRRDIDFDSENVKLMRKQPDFKLFNPVRDLVGLIKNNCIIPKYNSYRYAFNRDQIRQIDNLVTEFEISWDEQFQRTDVVERAVRLVIDCIPQNGRSLTEISFDDMLYLPLALNLEFPKYDIILTDESQDFNKCQIEFLPRSLKRNSKVVVVGDSFQSIYKFRGADSRAMDNIYKVLKPHNDCTVLTLPLNYRSDKQIIKHAQGFVPELEGSSKAEGYVGGINFYDAINRANNEMVDISMKDGVDFAERSLTNCRFCFLCRTNVPLILTAYELIKNDKKVKILGRSTIAAPMIDLIGDLCKESEGTPKTERINTYVDNQTGVEILGLNARLRDYEIAQSAKLEESGFDNKLEELHQRCDCIRAIIEKTNSELVIDVVNEIERLFTDNGSDESCIILSSGHRSKGLEFNVVFVLRPDLMPHPLAEPNEDGSWSEDQQQEKNIQYVVATRAKNRLYYVNDWPFEQLKQLSQFESDHVADGDSDSNVERGENREDTESRTEALCLSEANVSKNASFSDDSEPF